MAKSGHVALAEMVWHDKETLVLIRPCKGRLVLQMIYYGTRPGISNQIAKGENPRLMSEEIELGRGLIKKTIVGKFRAGRLRR
jgi:non-homologous end joining protein Ku